MANNNKPAWIIACEWYNADEVERCINSTPIATRLELRPQIPHDVTSREFAEWLTDQYRLAMAKGIQIGRGTE